jgi:predicted PurR-regulated permease PerM
MEKKKIKRAVKVIIIVCLVVIAGYFILNAVIQKKIRQQFTNLSPALATNFSMVHVDIFSSSVSLIVSI